MSLQNILKDTESGFSIKSLSKNIYGYQIDTFTKWLPGYTESDIHELETEGVKLNKNILQLLLLTKGLSKEQVNLNSNGESDNISYNQGWRLTIKNIIYYINGYGYDKLEDVRSALSQEFNINFDTNYLIPIFSHRFIVTPKEGENGENIVYSVFYDDAIVYAASLTEYLKKEFM